MVATSNHDKALFAQTEFIEARDVMLDRLAILAMTHDLAASLQLDTTMNAMREVLDRVREAKH